jgi:hypothetical protein
LLSCRGSEDTYLISKRTAKELQERMAQSKGYRYKMEAEMPTFYSAFS